MKGLQRGYALAALLVVIAATVIGSVAYIYTHVKSDETGSATTSGPGTARPSITLLYPNGGETLIRGQRYEIRWSDYYLYDVNTVSLRLVDGRTGASMEILPATAIRSSGIDGTSSYEWVVPPSLFPGNNSFKIEIFEHDRSVRDASDSHFTIL